MKWFKSYRVIYVSAARKFWVVNSRFRLQYRVDLSADNSGVPEAAIAKAKQIAEKKNLNF
jgi:hypothetical protein